MGAELAEAKKKHLAFFYILGTSAPCEPTVQLSAYPLTKKLSF